MKNILVNTLINIFYTIGLTYLSEAPELSGGRLTYLSEALRIK